MSSEQPIEKPLQMYSKSGLHGPFGKVVNYLQNILDLILLLSSFYWGIQWLYCWKYFQTYIACYMLLGDMIFKFTFTFKLLIEVVAFIYICSFQHVEFIVKIQQIRCSFKFLPSIYLQPWWEPIVWLWGGLLHSSLTPIPSASSSSPTSSRGGTNYLTLLSFKKVLFWSSDSFSSVISIFW